MEYVNSETGVRINLDDLTPEEKRFYKQALKRFHENAKWLAFDEFAFGMSSPIYKGRKSHLDVLENSLYLVLKDISLQLGVQQGLIRRAKKSERKAVA
ncbi:MAG TPA: hypothetical protein VIX17_02020 [Pyrinomonadaceae bacterium]|jgi:hypothetical protein